MAESIKPTPEEVISALPNIPDKLRLVQAFITHTIPGTYLTDEREVYTYSEVEGNPKAAGLVLFSRGDRLLTLAMYRFQDMSSVATPIDLDQLYKSGVDSLHSGYLGCVENHYEDNGRPGPMRISLGHGHQGLRLNSSFTFWALQVASDCIKPTHTKPPRRTLTTITTPQGLEFELNLRSNPAGLSEEELEVVGAITKAEVEMVLRQEHT
ncbi:MAG: hypothetical protein Q7S44_02715 [bacterium]|nr:hypothetical protein [bacterium]